MSETSDARSDIELDDEAKQLRLAAEKAKYRRAIVEALKAAEEDFPSVVPKVENAPTGSTSVGVGAGSLGPWQAHIRLNDLAAKIAEEAQKALGDGARVLVTEDHVVLEGDWAARIVAAELENVLKRLACLIVVGQRHVSDLPLKLAQYSETWASAGCFLEEEAPRQRWADSNRPQGAPAEAVAAPAPLPAAVVAGALASSVGLIGLLGADFALSAVSVKANASELAILTATNLVQACRETKPTVEVEVAALGGADASRTLTQFRLVLARNEMLTTALRRLQSALAPATMEQADLSALIHR